MADLIAQGPETSQRWRKRLPPNQTVVLGRDAGALSAKWDGQISREHAELTFRGQQLEVVCKGETTNPIFVRGHKSNHFTLKAGQHFVIGSTTFTFTTERVRVNRATPAPVAEQTFSIESLHQWRYRDAEQRIEALTRIPELLSGSVHEQELLVRLSALVLNGVRSASAIAVVQVDEDQAKPVKVLHWDRRAEGNESFAPSERLVRRAVSAEESVVHVWNVEGEAGATLTQNEDNAWAFCIPMLGELNDSWAIYVSGGNVSVGKKMTPEDLRDDLKFTEVVATTVAGLRNSQLLQQKMHGYRQFFSPVVLEALSWQNTEEALAPREVEVSVLFCDLRGFSLSAEKSAHDLHGLLKRVSDALGIMTHHILASGGVVGDFHGDAAMGFWGWPIIQADAPRRACRAALAIQEEFERSSTTTDHALHDFRVGIGIATGRAVAGKIGSIDQVKVTVFGPVVNLASRLEGMTSSFHASILIDETTAEVVREEHKDTGSRVRKVAMVRPYKMENALTISELLPAEDRYPQLTNDHISTYESALHAFQKGDWERAYELLHDVPPDDRVKDFLTVLIAQHQRTPPTDWNGIVELENK